MISLAFLWLGLYIVYGRGRTEGGWGGLAVRLSAGTTDFSLHQRLHTLSSHPLPRFFPFSDQLGTGFLGLSLWAKSGRIVKLATHLQLAMWWRISEIILSPLHFFNFLWRNSPTMALAPSWFTLWDHRPTRHRRTLNEGSAGRRGLCLPTHIIHWRQTYKLQVGFEPAIPASEWAQT